ncbi:TIGR02594 family protein [Tenacibaculum sp. 190524A02b]|uniref:TIGR02594 family protein n=1 Tax=Tenacibaculum vairaonense TaxID=3137860 RepID=UPI0031FB655D
MNKILEIALSQIGIKEQAGEQDNPAVLKYFNEIGYNGAALKDETAWCSAYANWVAKTAGLQYSGKLNARSWLQVGNKVSTPQMGDVVVFWRESPSSWKGHVGFFIRETQDEVFVLGGNQNNQVKISAYPKNRLLEYRRL